MRIIDIITTSNANLFRSPLRTFLTVLAVFIGTSTLTLTTGLGSGVRDFVNKQISSISAPGLISVFPSGGGSGNPLTEPQEYEPSKNENRTVSTFSFSLADVEKIKKIDNVKSVHLVYFPTPEYITRQGQKKYVIASLDQHVENFETPLAAGRVPQTDKNEEILLSYRYLKPLGFSSPEAALGQNVVIAYRNIEGNIREREYKVVGVLVNSLSGSLIRINVAELQAMALWQQGRDPGAFAIFVLTDPQLSKESFNKVKSDLRDQGYFGVTIDDQINQINTIIDTVQLVLNTFAVIVIIAGGIGIINTLLMSVYEGTREIGLMKALGMRSHEVFLIFTVEAMLIGFWGGVFGIASGTGMGYIINFIASETLLKDLQGFVLMVFPFESILPILLGTMFLGLIAGTIPAIKASKLDPIEALRYE